MSAKGLEARIEQLEGQVKSLRLLRDAEDIKKLQGVPHYW